MKNSRNAEVSRQTKETSLKVNLNLDGGLITIDSGIGFFDHMLNSLATYAGWGLILKAEGDLQVDHHHTVEDTGLVLGEAISISLGDYLSHARFASSLTVMDDALVEVALDIAKRPYLHFQLDWPQANCAQFEVCLVEEFWRALSQRAGITLHIIGRHGRNSHHLSEAVFKGVGRALKQGLAPSRSGAVLSTKGAMG